MSLKTTMFQEIRSIVLEENSSQKLNRRTLGLVKNIIPSATSLRGVYEFQHTSLSFKDIHLWNYLANKNQTWSQWSLAGPLSKLCTADPGPILDLQIKV